MSATAARLSLLTRGDVGTGACRRARGIKAASRAAMVSAKGSKIAAEERQNVDKTIAATRAPTVANGATNKPNQK